MCARTNTHTSLFVFVRISRETIFSKKKKKTRLRENWSTIPRKRKEKHTTNINDSFVRGEVIQSSGVRIQLRGFWARNIKSMGKLPWWQRSIDLPCRGSRRNPIRTSKRNQLQQHEPRWSQTILKLFFFASWLVLLQPDNLSFRLCRVWASIIQALLDFFLLQAEASCFGASFNKLISGIDEALLGASGWWYRTELAFAGRRQPVVASIVRRKPETTQRVGNLVNDLLCIEGLEIRNLWPWRIQINHSEN